MFLYYLKGYKKKMKKFISILLALVLMMSFAVTAFAAEPGDTTAPVKGSITIGKNTEVDENKNVGNMDPIDGQTYTIYRIFDLESFNAETGAYSYKVSEKWTAFFEEGAKGLEFVTIDDQGYVTWIEGKSAAEFAVEAIKFAKENNIENDGTGEKKADEELKFSDLELGYYLVDSTAGALCSLDTTNPDVTINEKNKIPTEKKEVVENSTDTAGKANDASIGDTVNYKVTIVAQPGAQGYVLHDTMSAGLTFDKNSVFVNAGNKTLAAGTDYVLNTEGIGDETFQIVFTQSYLDTITEETTIVISYSAILNENAVIAGEGNSNTSTLDYGDNNKTETSETKTYTWEVDVYKFTKNDEEQKPLAGAEFVILRGEAQVKQVALLNNGKVTEWVTYDEEKIPDDAKFVTSSTGLFKIQGLDAGTYYLHETKAPDGYNKLAKDVKFVIGREADATDTSKLVYKPGDGITNTDGKNQVEVENKSGAELPSTGGIGTTIFYVLGGLMVTGAVVVLVSKKRMEQ